MTAYFYKSVSGKEREEKKFQNCFCSGCSDHDEMASKFLQSMGSSGSCVNLESMCHYILFFVDGFQDYNTIGEICRQTCGLCIRKFLENKNNFLKFTCSCFMESDKIKLQFYFKSNTSRLVAWVEILLFFFFFVFFREKLSSRNVHNWQPFESKFSYES